MTQKRATPAKKGKNVSSTGGKKWLLAVDPFSGFDMSKLREMTLSLASSQGDEVIAAYVLAPASFNWTGEFSGPWMRKFKPAAEQKLRELFPNDKLVKTTVVPCKHAGLRASAQTLVRFARKIKAETIVISTHGRTGLERFTLGSFAETLILTSKVPVLVVNPARKVPAAIRRILVPTDLTKKSDRFVGLNADLARQIGAEVTLFHKQPDPLDPLIQQGVYTLGGGWVSVQNFIDEELEAKQKLISRLEQMVLKCGVGVNHVIDASPAGLIAAINAAAKSQRADMISVWTHAGAVSAAILGSVARGLVRSSDVPVLVWH